MSILKKVVLTLSTMALFFFPVLFAMPTNAQTSPGVQGKLNSALDEAGKTGFGYQSAQSAPGLSQLIGQYVTYFLGFTGTIAFIMFLYGGFLWLTAQGNDDQVSTAKKYLFNATIGIAIIVVAYSLTYYITDVLYKAAR